MLYLPYEKASKKVLNIFYTLLQTHRHDNHANRSYGLINTNAQGMKFERLEGDFHVKDTNICTPFKLIFYLIICFHIVRTA